MFVLIESPFFKTKQANVTEIWKQSALKQFSYKILVVVTSHKVFNNRFKIEIEKRRITIAFLSNFYL